MSTPKTAKVATAVTKYSDLDLSSQHVTTANFMEFNVAKHMSLCPRQSLNINMTTFSRLEPLKVPTFGNAEIHNRAYFVPYRTVMRGFNEFIDDTTVLDYSGNAILPVKPFIRNYEIANAFIDSSLSSLVPNIEDPADFVYYSPGGVSQRRKFTVVGKYAYKLLRSLGYGVVFDARAGITHDALHLLSFIKVYYDWYYPSAYVEDEWSNRIKAILEIQPTDDYGVMGEYFDSVFLQQLFYELHRVSYDSDYFVSAWDNPVAPNSGSFSNVSVKDVSTPGSESVKTLSNGTAVVRSYDYGVGGAQPYNELTQFAIDALKSVTDYMKRHQLAGARVLDRYLARWGVQLPAEKLNRSVFIGQSISKLQFGDVTATADTAGASLGTYAGKGFGADTSNIVDFTTTEFGSLIIVSTIVPKTAYYQGCDRTTMRQSRFDFYTPEFDNLGVQALSTRELFIPTLELNPEDASTGIDYNNAVFGFVPRYAELKRGYDVLSGDYVLPTKNVGREGYTLMRDVSHLYYGDDRTEYENIVHDINFVQGGDAGQYNRIFTITDSLEDKFNVIHNFVIKTRFPGSSLYDSYEFKDHEKAQKVTVDINGVRAN